MVFSQTECRQLMLAATEIADRAGEVILDVYATDFDVRHKDDASPVTEADERAEALILPALRTLLPGIPAIGEEAVSQGIEETVIGRTFWLVDPIDGTKEFLRRSGEFTVNIALIEDGEPVMGVVTAPGRQPAGDPRRRAVHRLRVGRLHRGRGGYRSAERDRGRRNPCT